MTGLGHTLRKVREEDRDAVRALIAAAFKRSDEADLVDRLWAEHAMTFERLAEISGAIVGYCAFSPVTCAPAMDGLLLGLGPLAVAPNHQRQGIGAELVKEGLKVCRDNNARLIAVLGDPEYYARFGFEPAAARKMSWAGFDAGDAFRIITLDEKNPVVPDTDEIRTIHYHPAFDAVS